MRQLISGVVIACCLLLSPQANAQFVFSASDETVDAGTTATVDFFVSSSSATPVGLSGASFGIDFGDNDSDALPTGLSSPVVNSSGLFTSVTASDVPSGIGANFNVQLDIFQFPGSVPVTNTPQQVFSVDFEVDESVPDGTTFVIDILGAGEAGPNDIFSLTDGTGSEFQGTVETGGGTITVNAIPEPGAGLALLVFGGLIAARRRRRC